MGSFEINVVMLP